MKLFDVNVLVYASREELPQHAKCRQLLDEARSLESPLGVSDIVLAGFVRLVCHRRTFKTPTPMARALDFATAIRNFPNAVTITPGRRHWPIFCNLLTSHRIPGDECWDAYLAAIAIESDCEWVSYDQGFARFPELRWINAMKI